MMVPDEQRMRRAITSSDKRISWSDYTDQEMQELAILADRYGWVRLLRKVQRATLRRALANTDSV